jgi:UDP:flavonoid glycosyltransferase YjiC (YdhE family)
VVHEPAALAAPLACLQLGVRNVTHGYGLQLPQQYLEDAMGFLGAEWRARGLDVPADGGLYRHLYLDIVPRSLQSSVHPTDGQVFHFNPYEPRSLSGAALPADVHLALESAAPGPRIYVSFGTVFNRSPVMLAAVRAAVRVGAMVVVTVGADGDPAPFSQIGGPVCVRRFVDQTALLPHCNLVVSHGGAGTVLGAAAHGVPQLVLPQAADHFRNAQALSSANAGRSLEPDDQTEERISEVMLGALHPDAMAVAAAKLAREMSAMPDATAAARWLEHW